MSSNLSRGRSSCENPERTSDWSADKVCNDLNVTLKYNDDPRSVFLIGYLELIGQNIKLIEYMKNHFESPDQEYKTKHECFQFALNTWKDMVIDSEFINDIEVSSAITMNNALDKPFEKSSLYHDFVEPKEKKQAADNGEQLALLRSTCQKIFAKLKVFSDQLLFVMDNLGNPSEKMFKDLFMAFVRIFDLKIFDTTNTPGCRYLLHHGEHTVTSIPGAVMSSYTAGTGAITSKLVSRVVAVVEVRKECSHSPDQDSESSPEAKKIRLGSRQTNSIAENVHTRLKGQHIGDMLAVTQSAASVFDFNGIFGFIIQGTKVTFVSLQSSKEYFANLLKKDKTKNVWADVRYSKECNLLTKEGRKDLIPVLLGIEKLVMQTV
ncbi:uncharacterized protein LOC127704586 [Mytilus californianus]|uniref:uncharacterized protein LOC127704586 n=1 Tax=Mytilus californianus TaxID=6549 RepID=UPI0022472317|nr:uncharacterized protein LOC127704586 [Mytilus californianus]XP_052064668.1 uncharacterized protein LOC127704586 [Mytilus californianus]